MELSFEELWSGKAPSVTRRGFCFAFFVDVGEFMGDLSGGLIPKQIPCFLGPL